MTTLSLDLEMSTPHPAYNCLQSRLRHLIHYQRDSLRASPRTYNSIPIVEPISVGCRPPVCILDPAGKEIATLQSGNHRFVLIWVADLCFVCDASGQWGVCGEARQCQLSKHHPMLSAIMGPDELIHIAKKLSLIKCTATDFREPGICLDILVFCWPCLQVRASDCAEYCSDELCHDASLICTESRSDSCQLPFFFIARLKVVFDIFEQRYRCGFLNLVC
jgi:hypothetical protein